MEFIINIIEKVVDLINNFLDKAITQPSNTPFGAITEGLKQIINYLLNSAG
jgi:hypothetical protein